MNQNTQPADFEFKRVEQDEPSEAPLPVPCKDEQPGRVYTKG